MGCLIPAVYMPRQLCLDFAVVSVNPYPYVYPIHTTRVQIEAFNGDPAVLCLDVENMQAPDL